MEPTTPPPGASTSSTDDPRSATPPPPNQPAAGPAVEPPPAPRDWPHLRKRPQLSRSATDRVVAGVAAGLGHHFGVDPALVRMAFVLLTFAGGIGVVAYGAAWVLLPVEDEERPLRPRRPPTIQQGVALGLITLGILLLFRALGLWLGDEIVWPLVLATAGSAVIWTRGDDQTKRALGRLRRRVPTSAIEAAAGDHVSPLRVVIGTVLVAVSIAGFLAANEAFVAARPLILAVIAAIVGAGLLFGPWLWRLATELSDERRERIRQEERAELAAHLHDSVLQTLALIQRSADQPRRMVALARRQERELRSWLYGSSGDPGHASTLADAVETIAEEVEAVHDLSVEVVVVGDTPVDDDVRALLAATREAAVNAAKHAEVTVVDVYVEVERDSLSAFVRDRGQGFDLGAVDGDRQGIRRSIVERVERRGGRANVWSSPGQGTAVEVSVPLRRRGNGRDRGGDVNAGAGSAPPPATGTPATSPPAASPASSAPPSTSATPSSPPPSASPPPSTAPSLSPPERRS